MDEDIVKSYKRSGRELRDRASESIYELRATLNSSPRRQSEREGRPSSPSQSTSQFFKQLVKRRHAGSQSRRNSDFGNAHHHSPMSGDIVTMENYNNAVDRLRTLLLSHTHGSSHSSRNRIKRGHRSSDIFPHHSQHEAPLAMEDAYTYSQSPRLSLGATATKVNTEPRPQDLLQIINGQSAYIQQLEGENKYCKEELHALKGRTEAVVAENVRLSDEMKDLVIKTALEESPFKQEKQSEERHHKAGTRIEVEQSGAQQETDTLTFVKWSQDLEKLKKMHEIRVRRLEEQLSSTKSELGVYEKQCDELRTKLRMAESVSLLSRKDALIADGLCVRCAQDDAVVANAGQPSNTSALHRVTQERDELVSRLTACQAAKEGASVLEAEAYEQVRQSIQLVEQAQLERTEAVVQREQAKEDIVRLQGRMAELVAEQQEKLNLEREATRRENKEEIAQLNHKLTKLSEELAGVTHQLDRVTREKVDTQAELDQTKMQIMQHEVQITKASEDDRVSATTAKVQRDDAMRQLERVRASMEQELRDARQDKSRCQNELLDVKRRLEQAEKDATTSKEECIKLVETVNTAEREASILRVSHESVDKGNRDALRMLRHRAEQKEQDLRQTIHNMEAQHSLTVHELENMLSDQQSLISKLRDECRGLTNQLESGTSKYRSEVRRLKQTNAELVARSDRLSHQHADMEGQCVEHGRLHRRMKARLHQMEEQNNKNAKQIYELLEKQTSLMQERQVLSREVEFLRAQTEASISFVLNRSETAWIGGDTDRSQIKDPVRDGNKLIPSKDCD